MDCPSTERLDPRMRRTRQLLQEALQALLHEKPFARISVQDITTQAGVNRATFYAHYTDKQELANQIIQDGLQAALRQRFSEPPPLTRESFVELALVVFDYLGRLHDSCPASCQEHQEKVSATVLETLCEMLGYLLSKRTAQPLFPNLNRETVATVLAWSLYGAAQSWSRSQSRPPALTICQEIATVLFPQP